MNAKAIKADHERLLMNLKFLQKQYSVKTLATALGVTPNTWINRMKEPWRKFSYDNFRSIAEYCHIELDSLLSGTLKIS